MLDRDRKYCSQLSQYSSGDGTLLSQYNAGETENAAHSSHSIMLKRDREFHSQLIQYNAGERQRTLPTAHTVQCLRKDREYRSKLIQYNAEETENTAHSLASAAASVCTEIKTSKFTINIHMNMYIYIQVY